MPHPLLPPYSTSEWEADFRAVSDLLGKLPRRANGQDVDALMYEKYGRSEESGRRSFIVIHTLRWMTMRAKELEDKGAVVTGGETHLSKGEILRAFHAWYFTIADASQWPPPDPSVDIIVGLMKLFQPKHVEPTQLPP